MGGVAVKRTPERDEYLRQQRAQRQLWQQRVRDNQCFNCGKSDWVDAIDNTGSRYKGCNNCIIVLPETSKP